MQRKHFLKTSLVVIQSSGPQLDLALSFLGPLEAQQRQQIHSAAYQCLVQQLTIAKTESKRGRGCHASRGAVLDHPPFRLMSMSFTERVPQRFWLGLCVLVLMSRWWERLLVPSQGTINTLRYSLLIRSVFFHACPVLNYTLCWTCLCSIGKQRIKNKEKQIFWKSTVSSLFSPGSNMQVTWCNSRLG